jgi:TRAP-type C4-dicarboxylate transport system permease small subunit
MRRIVLLVLLFVVVLVVFLFVVFLGLNWGTRFDLKLGFGSRDVPVSVIAWTLGSFIAGAVCTALVFVTILLKKGRKNKVPAVTQKDREEEKENAG